MFKEFLSITILVAFYLVNTTAISDQCMSNDQRSCPNLNRTVFAVETNITECKTFQNRCFFNREQVRRRKNNENLLTIVDKCPRTCGDECTEGDNLVCGEYNGEVKIFPNKCTMENINCMQNKNFTVVECPVL